MKRRETALTHPSQLNALSVLPGFRSAGVGTLRLAGEMAEQSGETMDSLIARVRSPGGTTAAAFDYLDGTDFRAIFSAAVTAARDRAVELADRAHEHGKDQ